MTNFYFVVFIGILFTTTLYQAREIGENKAIIKEQQVTLDFTKKFDQIKLSHQVELDVKDRKHAIETQNYKNIITEQAIEFEEKGLTNPIGLSDDNTDWLNKFMRENSRVDPNPARYLPPTEPIETRIPTDRNDDN